MLLATVTLTPSTSALPGSNVLQSIVNGIASWALIAALASLIIGAAMWALGNYTQNMQHSSTGRRAVLTSLVASVLLGAAPTLINFFFASGATVK